jgi:hypothetical protein
MGGRARDLFALAFACFLAGVGLWATIVIGRTPRIYSDVIWALFAMAACFGTAAFFSTPAPRRASQFFWRHMPEPKLQRKNHGIRVPTKCVDGGISTDRDGVCTVFFTTDGNHERRVDIYAPIALPVPRESKPTRLVFIRPFRHIVCYADLPAHVPGRRGDMLVTHFVEGGFVIDDRECVGDQVEVQIYFD